MNLQQLASEDGTAYRVVEVDGGVEHVVDFGTAAGDAAVDVVDGTAIVVVDGDQYELSVDGDAEAFIRNGVLTIEEEHDS